MRSISRGFVGVLAFALALGSGYATVRAADPTVPGVSFTRDRWPHGTTGKAVPHGSVFSRP